MPSIGEELKRERELRGISLREISDETKVGIRFLEAIESDRLDLVPGEFYRRAYIRAYSRCLGIDPDRMVATYQFRATASPLPAAENEAGRGEPRPEVGLGRVVATRWAVVVLVGVGLSGAAVAFWPGRGIGDVPIPVAPSVVSRPSVEPPAEAVATAEPILREELEENPSRGDLPLRLLLKVDEPCWLELRADDQVAAQGLMLRGFEREIQARDGIRLWLGNASGVSVWINGSRAKPFGGPGQVRKDVHITPENYTEFLLRENEG